MRIFGMWFDVWTYLFIWVFLMIGIYCGAAYAYDTQEYSASSITIGVMFFTAIATIMFVLFMQEKIMHEEDCHYTVWDCFVFALFTIGFFACETSPLLTTILWIIALIIIIYGIVDGFKSE